MAGVGLATAMPASRVDIVASADAGQPPAYPDDVRPKPLPFDPTTVCGLSPALLRAHHEHHYTSAVHRLNLVRRQVGRLERHGPPLHLASLKRDELVAANAVVLHELYFDNLGPDGRPGPVAWDAGRIAAYCTWQPA